MYNLVRSRSDKVSLFQKEKQKRCNNVFKVCFVFFEMHGFNIKNIVYNEYVEALLHQKRVFFQKQGALFLY